MPRLASSPLERGRPYLPIGTADGCAGRRPIAMGGDRVSCTPAAGAARCLVASDVRGGRAVPFLRAGVWRRLREQQ
jgi:hypothetical protein